MPRLSRGSLGLITAATMAVAAFPIVIFSVLSTDIIAEFDIQRWQVGLLVTANAGLGALLSPFCGRLTDRIGPSRSTIAVVALGVGALTWLALSPVYLVFLIGALLTGIPHGWANPATNALIVSSVPPGERGAVTGVKQSGVQMGMFVGAVTLPPLAALWNWRLALLAFVFVQLGVLIATFGLRPESDGGLIERKRGIPVPSIVKVIAVYAAITGLSISAISTFLPLFAQEIHDWSATAAGWLVGAMGLVGVVARIFWGSVSDRRLGHRATLAILSIMSAASAALLVAASFGAAKSWIMAPAALLHGAGVIAANAVGMLIVMDYSPSELVGRGTGIVSLGFYLGLSAGAPLMGLSVDKLAAYWPGWLAVTLLLLASAAIAIGIRPGQKVAARH